MNIRAGSLTNTSNAASTFDSPAAALRDSERGKVLALQGEWSLRTLEQAGNSLDSALDNNRDSVTAVDLSRVTRLDSAGAMRINQCRIRGKTILPVLSANPDFTALLDISRLPQSGLPAGSSRSLNPLALLDRVGYFVCTQAERVQNILSFFGQFVITAGRSLLTPHKVRWTSLIYHMDNSGLRAVPIVALLSFLIGMVLAYMAAAQLVLFGAQIFVIGLLEVATFREMGVLLTAILVAGRSGSSFTAQIGAMVAGQEVDAMRSMGFDPMEILVLPRIVALIVMLPVLTLAANVMSLAGGMIALWLSLDITPSVFIHTLKNNINLHHFYIGLVKAPFFALLIGCTGCSLGFQVTGSAESVGQLTTRAVVESIFLVILMDALFALFFSSIGV